MSEGLLLPHLVPHDWPLKDQHFCRPLFIEPSGFEVPLVACSKFVNEDFVFTGPESGIDEKTAHDTALRNLRGLKPETKWLSPKSGRMMICAHQRAAAFLLDPPFMQSIHREFGSERLYVIIPAQSTMLITAADDEGFRMLNDMSTAFALVKPILSQRFFSVTNGCLNFALKEKFGDVPTILDEGEKVMQEIRERQKQREEDRKNSFWRRLFG